MAKIISCPPATELQRLASGQLPPEELEALVEHLEACGPCLTRVQELAASDTLIEAFGKKPTVADGPEESVVTHLIKRIAAMGVERATPPAEPETMPPLEVPLAVPVTETVEDDNGEPLSNFLAPPERPGELGRLGRYRVLKELGRGGMGVVLRAEDPNLERPVALKVMLPSFARTASARARFIREAKAAAAVRHDHVVAIYDVNEDRGVPYLAMEFLQGEPLDWRLGREGMLPIPDVLRIGREIAEGLAAAHERGLVHRDIKPANIWLEAPRGRVKILDFGLARTTSKQASLTQSGTIVGTPAYMAPEQATGQPIDGRADLFSLGCVLYGMCTGRPPFRGNNTLAILSALATETPRPPAELNPAVPPTLSALIMRLLAKDPAARPASAAEVARLLIPAPVVEAFPTEVTEVRRPEFDFDAPADAPTEAFSMAAPVVPPQPLPHVAPRLPRRHMGLLVAAAGGLLAALALLVVFLLPTKDGHIRVEINDDAIEATLTRNGFLIKGAGPHEIKVEAGEQKLKVKRGDLEFETESFVVKKGETVTLKLEFLKGRLQVVEGERTIGSEIARAKTPAVAKKTPVKAETPAPPPQGEVLHRIVSTAHVYETEISADGKFFSGAGDFGKSGIVPVYDIESGKATVVLRLGPEHERWFTHARLLPRSKLLAVSYQSEKDMYLWDLDTGKVAKTLAGHTAEMPDFAVAPDGKHILSWADDGKLLLWDVETGTLHKTLSGYVGKVTGVFTSDGKQILTFGKDDQLRLWTVETGTQLKKLIDSKLPRTTYSSTAVSSDGIHAVSCNAFGAIQVWDLTKETVVRLCEDSLFGGTGLRFVADGKRIVGSRVFRSDKDVRDVWVWETATGKLVRKFTDLSYSDVQDAISPDGRYLLRSSTDDSVLLVDVDSGLAVRRFENCPNARAFSYSADGTIAVAGSFRKGMYVFRLGPPPNASAPAPPATPARNADPDRAAAEWVLSLGSYVGIEVDGQPVPVKTVDDLPKTPFSLVSINVNRNRNVSDETLAVCRGLRNLKTVIISNSSATDKALAYFADSKQLETLHLHSTQVTDEGVLRLASFTALKGIRVEKTAVTEAAVRKLAAALPQCQIIWNGGIIEPPKKE